MVLSPTRNYWNCTFPRLTLYAAHLPVLFHLTTEVFHLVTEVFSISFALFPRVISIYPIHFLNRHGDKCIKDRYDQDGYKIYCKLEMLLLKGHQEDRNYSHYDELFELYQRDIVKDDFVDFRLTNDKITARPLLPSFKFLKNHSK